MKNQITKTKYENDLSYNKTGLLINFIRKLIVSDENLKNENKNSVSKIDSVNINEKLKINSSCESSGYDSLKNIKEQAWEIIKQHSLECCENEARGEKNLDFAKNPNFASVTNSSKDSELDNFKCSLNFMNSENFCLYKIYKSNDGGILLKESQSAEFNKGGYVIGRRIHKETTELQEFSEKDNLLQKNFNREFRNNSTQTEFTKKIARKPGWFRKNKKKSQWVRKRSAFLESSSNSSFPKSSDSEEINLTLKTRNYSPSLQKCSLRPFSHKKSTAVDTSDFNYPAFMKIPENKIIMLFNSMEIEKNLECKFLNSSSIGEEIKLDKQKEIKTIGMNLSEKRKHFYTSDSSPIVPVSWLEMENPELVSQRTKLKQLCEVEKEENSNFSHPAPETKNIDEKKLEIHDEKAKKKKSKHFRIFKKKKKITKLV